MSRHLLVGLSTRAMADSAVKNSNNILTLDYFGDQDQKYKVINYSLAREHNLPFSAANLFAASKDLTFSKVSYTSNLENHPDIVAAFEKRAKVAGNSSETLRRVRCWPELRSFCLDNSILHPRTLLPGEEHLTTPDNTWICKPVNGGGGHGVSFWDGSPLDDLCILQAYMDGTPASAAFVADGKKSVVIGMTRQLIGHSEFGAKGFGWCGNILPLFLQADVTQSILAEVADTLGKLTRHYGLQGIGGIDFVIAKDRTGSFRPYLLEINPRYTGSMELIEWAYGINIYSLHLAACGGRLPAFSLADHQDDTFFGKGIVFARQDLIIPGSMKWPQSDRRDLPYPGDIVDKGHPICTVLAHGDTYRQCFNMLCRNVNDVRRETGDTVEQ